MKLALSLFWRILLLQLVFNLLVVVPFRNTLFMSGEFYMQWKPTALWWAFGVLLLCFHFVTKNGLVHIPWGRRLQKSESFWKRLNLALVAFYLALGLVSVGVSFLVSVETWLKFKLAAPWLFIVLFLLFVPRALEAEKQQPNTRLEADAP